MLETPTGVAVLNEINEFLQLHYANKVLTDDEAIYNIEQVIAKYHQYMIQERSELEKLEQRVSYLNYQINYAKKQKELHKDEYDLYHAYWTRQSTLEAELRLVEQRLKTMQEAVK